MYYAWLPALLGAFTISRPAQAFELVREHKGATFFDEWDFYGFWDNLTSGDVEYLNRADAFSNELVQSTSSGSTIIRVDNFTNVPFNYKRNSIRIESKDSYDFGSLWVFDLNHLPYGCSVWPSIWTHGEDWPNGGEIDIIEGINLQGRNQVALHTIDGCTHQEGTNEVGWYGVKNCSTPAGCTVQDPDARSYGAPFAAAGGGAWATQFDVAGVFIWFWTRDSVPDNIKNGGKTLDISSWGPPMASYPSSTCEMEKYFTAQKIIIDITLCGVWAGIPSIYNATCKGTGPTGMCYPDNVIGPGDNYDNAYFDINFIRTYTNSPPTTTTTTTSHSSPSPTQTGDDPDITFPNETDAATRSSRPLMLATSVVLAAVLVLL